MELELKKDMLQCYRQVMDQTISQEETQEAIVPDAYPDILRIVSASGQITLNEREIREKEIHLKGQVEAWVLYLPEEGETLQKITVKLPFYCKTTAEDLGENDEIFAIPSLSHCEAKVLNPRKVLIKVDIMVEISGFQRNNMLLCCGVEEAEAQGVQQRIHAREIRPLCAVKSKQFTFDESLTLQGQEEVEEILSLRFVTNCGESKLIGNKLIFKGETELQILYVDSEGKLEHSRHQLPFSQIMEVDDMGESGYSNVSIVLESFQVNPSYRGGRTVELSLDLLAQATVRGEKQLSLLEDAYSVNHYLEVEKDSYTLVTMAEEFVVPQPVRQIFETTVPIQRVEDSWVSVSKVSQTREGEQLRFSCDLTLFLLCYDEAGSWHTQEFHENISYSVDCATEVTSCCRCLVQGEVFATPAPGGVELRLTPQFLYTMVESQPITAVVSSTVGEERERGSASVVLRLPQTEETLWDIAKNYGTTMQQIMQANKLEEECLPMGQMLLIPSMR